MKRKINICIIAQFTDDFFYGTLIKNIQQYIHKIGGKVFVLNSAILYSSPETQSFLSQYILLAKNHIDGYIVLPHSISDEYIHLISESGKPVVLINKVLDKCSLLTVKDDGFIGMFNVVEHLVKEGHQKIAFIGCFYLYDMVERFEGYKYALEKNGIPFNQEFVYKVSLAVQSEGEIAARQMLKCTPDVSAVVCSNDLIAYGVIEICKSLGLRIPADKAVCGYDNSIRSRECIPKITTAEQNIPLLGETAAKILATKITGCESTNKVTNISPKLIIRESSVLEARTDHFSPLSSLDDITSIKLCRYLEKVISNTRLAIIKLKEATFENISDILPLMPIEFDRACYGRWVYENNIPKSLSIVKINNFATEEELVGKEFFLEDFPPSLFIDDKSCFDNEHILHIIPIRTSNYEMGVFSYIAPISKYSEFINVNYSVSNYDLFSFALEKELYAKEIQEKNNEKISAINTMVVGIAHELNTPIGIGISASTFITSQADKLMKALESGNIKRQDFINALKDIRESSDSIYRSLNRSSELVKTFKLLSYNKPDELKQNFNLRQNTENIITLLGSKLVQ
ncbi:MAG TPA: substrate-binding domain-containing protein, partial [Clostridia bacterium]